MLLAPDELAAPGVVYRMTGRWREENWFRYGRAHFDLESLDSYAVTPDDPDRTAPNPAKETAAAVVRTARKASATPNVLDHDRMLSLVDAVDDPPLSGEPRAVQPAELTPEGLADTARHI